LIIKAIMSEKFRNKYRVQTARLSGYDYSSKGIYFLTICTLTKIPCLGDIINGQMILSDAGVIVREYWLNIPSHYPNIHLDEFIVMPNHIHGIIVIGSGSCDLINETPKLGNSVVVKNKNPLWKSKSIGSIVNQFKRACTIQTKILRLDFQWQPRYYDHIIHSEHELDHIRNYIKNNPKNWLKEKHNFNPRNT
jgi:putative transposase